MPGPEAGNRARRGNQEAGSNHEKGRGNKCSSGEGQPDEPISFHNVPDYKCGAMLRDRRD